MTEPKRPLKVFLCHAHADTLAGTGRDPVRTLHARLTKDGVDAWLDKEKLLPGQDWELEIRKAVREADVVVVCLSKQFNQAGFRQKEVRLALDTAMEKPEGEIFIIPARLEECDNLESLRKWHWVDLFEDDGYEMLMRALRARANKIGATVQTKKSWLPIGNTQPAVVKKPSLPVDKPEKKTIQNPSSLKRKLNIKKLIGITAQIFLAIMVVAGLVLTIWQPSIPRPSFLGGTQIDKTHSLSVQPSETLSVVQTKVSTITPTSLPTEITDEKGVPMRLVPEGEFIMGDTADHALEVCGQYFDNCNRIFFTDEEPPHKVYLNTYYVDKYEVTNARYKVCVNAGVCKPPTETKSSTRPSYYENSEFDDYPVIYVNWGMANNYCLWRGARLPTEAEWEKAARGSDGRTYPWGESLDCSRANYASSSLTNGCIGDTNKVGNYASGQSPYGLYDMGGNVWEWVADLYSETYYQNSPYLNPLGPDTGSNRVLRGGSWWVYAAVDLVRTTGRLWDDPATFHFDDSVGFRCARSAP